MARIAIISIGSELLSGETINTNASTIAKALSSFGYRVEKVIVVGDQEKAITSALKELSAEFDCIIATGGLGPTGDDLSKKIFATFFQTPLEFSSKVYQDLSTRYGNSLPCIKELSTVPKGSELIPNPTGTAWGFIFEHKIALLPGFPPQMEEMLELSVIPWIRKKWKSSVLRKNLYFSNLYETEIDPLLRAIEKQYPLSIGICPSFGILKVYIEGQKEEDIEQASQLIRASFDRHFFSDKGPHLEATLQEYFIKNAYTLALAESCTGGAISQMITRHPGSSKYFLGSLVTYSNSLKEKLLHVDKTILEKKGAVSDAAVCGMLSGLMDVIPADFGGAVTGYAGPEGEFPGVVWIAVQKRNYPPIVRKFEYKSSRIGVIERASNTLLGMIWDLVRDTN